MLAIRNMLSNTLLVQAVALAIACQAFTVQAETANWVEPDIDNWFYINGSGGGSRDTAPSWGDLALNMAGDAFEEGSNLAPSRAGMMMIAFETSDQITTGFSPSQYSISSVTLTTRMEDATAGSLTLSTQVEAPSALLSEAIQSGITANRPIELYGVDFRNGFEGFALGDNQTGLRFQESFNGYFAAGYNAYPIVEDGNGNYRDVSNNITGGFSATEASGTTAPFAATPWAIGHVAGLSEGQTVPDDSTFDFQIDLNQPGVLDYLQLGLSEGAVGFFLSSLHAAEELGGTTSYPQWYTKENDSAGAEAPTLSIEYSIVTSSIPGDYDGDGDVDSSDHAEWTTSYGTTVSNPGDGADGNSDGQIDAADYTVWRDNYSASLATAKAEAVPEPSQLLLIVCSLAIVLCKSEDIR